jgi:cytochrome c oxidase subunit II
MLKLHFTEPQTAIAILFAVLAVGLAALFAVIALQTRRELPFERVRAVGYRIRRYWLGFLAILLVIVVGGSWFELPFSRGAGHRTVVTVSGGQFYWSVTPPQVPAGTRVRFDVTSSDVNHGLGLYGPGGELLGSVQAMPGYHNKLDVKLNKPGEYIFSCLEYCGLGHHRMSRPFRVVKR